MSTKIPDWSIAERLLREKSTIFKRSEVFKIASGVSDGEPGFLTGKSTEPVFKDSFEFASDLEAELRKPGADKHLAELIDKAVTKGMLGAFPTSTVAATAPSSPGLTLDSLKDTMKALGVLKSPSPDEEEKKRMATRRFTHSSKPKNSEEMAERRRLLAESMKNAGRDQAEVVAEVQVM